MSTVSQRGKLLWLLTAGGFFSFFIFGFVDNLKGPTLPALLRDLDFSYAQGGTILFGAYFGFLIATLTTGLLADTFGNKMVLIMAGVCLTVGVIAFSNIRVFGGLVMAMGVIGLGMGAIEVGGNALIVDLHREQSGRYLNLLAAFHGIGSLLVPIYAAQLLQNGFSWQQTFLYSLPGVILFLLWFSVAPYPHTRTESTQGFSWQQVRQTGFSPSMRWFYLLLSFYVATELGVAAWLVEFLQQVRGLSVGWSSLFLSLFFGAIMVGRLVGSMVVERVGYLKSMLVAMLAAMICLALGIFGPEPLIILVPSPVSFSLSSSPPPPRQWPVTIGKTPGLCSVFSLALGDSVVPLVPGPSAWRAIGWAFSLALGCQFSTVVSPF